MVNGSGHSSGANFVFSILSMIDIVPSVVSSKVKLFADDCVKGSHYDFKLAGKYNK